MRIQAVALVASASVLVGCAPTQDASIEANKEVIRLYVEAYNSDDFARLDDLMHSDFRRHSKSTIEVSSLQEFKAQLEHSAKAFPDGRIEIVTIVAEADNVVTYCTWSGTQKAPFAGFPASGQKAEMPFFYLFRVEEGKIAEFWTEWDNVNLLTQLGHFPPPSGE